MERRIGFVGCYSHDIILLLAKVLGYLGKNVVLMDRNKRHILRASLPVPEGFDFRKEKLEYDGFFYGEQMCTVSDLTRYDVELIDFGMEAETDDFIGDIEFVVVTDLLPHHMDRILKCNFRRDLVKVCVMRDVFHDFCRKEKSIKDFLQKFPNREEIFLPPDFRDTENRYVCEMMYEYSVKRASWEMQEVIFRLVGFCYSEYSEKMLRQKIREKERRRYR